MGDGRQHDDPQMMTIPKPPTSAQLIISMCEEVKAMLLRKNEAYGDSALDPMRVFSRASPLEQLKVRMDDKISRLARGKELPDESFDDTVRDLIGYLVLYLVARRRG